MGDKETGQEAAQRIQARGRGAGREENTYLGVPRHPLLPSCSPDVVGPATGKLLSTPHPSAPFG